MATVMRVGDIPSEVLNSATQFHVRSGRNTRQRRQVEIPGCGCCGGGSTFWGKSKILTLVFLPASKIARLVEVLAGKDTSSHNYLGRVYP